MKHEERNSMKTVTRLAFISIALVALQAQGSSSPVPPQMNGICLSHYVSNWEMVKDVFVNQPTQKTALNGKRKTALGFATAGLTVVGAAFLGFLQIGISRVDSYNYRRWSKVIDFCEQASFRDDDGRPTDLKLGFLLGAIGGGILGFLGVRKALRPITLRDAQLWQLENVLHIWKDARTYFPEELRDAIDELKHLKDKKAPEYSKVRQEVLSFVLAKLKAHSARLKNQRFVFPEISKGYTYRAPDHKILGVGSASAELIDEDNKEQV
jgi:hypothetical protein